MELHGLNKRKRKQKILARQKRRNIMDMAYKVKDATFDSNMTKVSPASMPNEI